VDHYDDKQQSGGPEQFRPNGFIIHYKNHTGHDITTDKCQQQKIHHRKFFDLQIMPQRLLESIEWNKKVAQHYCYFYVLIFKFFIVSFIHGLVRYQLKASDKGREWQDF
jgi:hypothetical protein